MPTPNVFIHNTSVNAPYTADGVILFTTPTGNCQLFSLSEVRVWLNPIINNEGNVKTNHISSCKQKFRDAAIKAGRKKLCLIDVKKYYIPTIKEVFQPDEIVLEKEYTSSNGSNMCIFILRINLSLY